MNGADMMSCLCLPSKTETSCDEGQDSDPPKVLKVYNRSLLFDSASRADAEALGGLLEYLQSQDKRLTDEEFRGDGRSAQPALYRRSRLTLTSGISPDCCV